MKNKMQKIIITVVTRNRPICLKRFLSLASSQTLQADEILVVDNDSEIETKRLVDDFSKNNKRIKYLNTEGNLGSAGGQSIALNYAVSNGFDLVYTLDDDCEPELDALERLYTKWLNTKNKEKTVLSSLSLALENNNVFSFALWKIRKSPFDKNNISYWNLDEIPESEIKNNIFWGWSHFFLGVLIPIDVIKICGSVNPKYFIRGDEFEYFIRLQKLNINLGTVTNSIVKHPREINTSKGSSDKLKQYYTIRNNTEIRLNYYSNFKYNRTMYLIWLFVMRTLGKNKQLSYLATKDAIKNDFSKSPEDIKALII